MVVMRRGTVVADDLSPKTATIQDVEDVITGEHLTI
jgi:simple sugar transport system ATP-binding protein